MHITKSDKPVVLYSLDMIISVGYRVNSKRGTQFRIWATQTLKDHLIRGYTLNERRLRERSIEMEQAVQLLSRTLTRHNRWGSFHSPQPTGFWRKAISDQINILPCK